MPSPSAEGREPERGRAWKLGTRASPLALWQAEFVRAALSPEIHAEIVPIRTSAENRPDEAPRAIGPGMFTREIDEALLDGRVDIAVHSLKDVPSELARGIVIAAVPPRASPFDAFISADGTGFAALRPGARIGTGSPRRVAQVLAHDPGLVTVPLRGNVATRLAKMRSEGLAGIILAEAGLARLGEAGRITEVLPPEILLPAVGQGAIAVAARAGDARVLGPLARLEHAPTRWAVTAERAFLARLRGGCLVPAAALATLEADGRVHIRGLVAALDGSRLVSAERWGDPREAESTGHRLAEEILARGGAEILGSMRDPV